MAETPLDTTATDISMADLATAPFRLIRPGEQRLPFVFAFPHSGRSYPHEFRQMSGLSAIDIRRSEDAYADLLFDTGPLPAPRIEALFPRAYVDVNRSPLEIDIEMFDGPLAFPTERTLHVVSGFGIIPRLIREGHPIHRDKISPYELTRRIEKFYFPYHRALSTLMKETRAALGQAYLIDCHTMPDAPDVADIVLGDRYGASVPPQMIRRAEVSFASEGFSVARNQPYAGGYTTGKFTRATENMYALQIEVKRSLYMHEDRLTLLPEFENVRNRLMAALTKFARNYHASQTDTAVRRAAE